jgi:DNA-binding NarL/FixJ family response regulator
VLRLLGAGHSNKEIAAALRLTEGTVKGYVSAVFTKLGVADRTQAALTAVRHGLVPG